MNFEPMKKLCDRLCDWRIPGNTIDIYKDGELVFEYCGGYADVENKIKSDAGKYMYMYSCSKITTCLAALQLYEKGYYALDDALCEYLPEFTDMSYINKNGEREKCKNKITIRQLFTMTAGFNYEIANTAEFNKAKELTNGKYDTLTVMKCLAERPLSFEPGERWQYSLCHDVLAAVVEKISGVKFRDYVKNNIFAPCGGFVTYSPNEAELQNMFTQYIFENGGEKDIIAAQSTKTKMCGGSIRNRGLSNGFAPGSEYDSGGAGVVASPRDFAAVMGAIANGGRTRSGERIISRGTIDLWRTNQLNASQKSYFDWTHYRGYGYGLGVRTMLDRAVSGFNGSYGEFGWAGAAGSVAIIDVEANIALYYGQHMLNNQEPYIFPRLRNTLYSCME